MWVKICIKDKERQLCTPTNGLFIIYSQYYLVIKHDICFVS